MYESITFMQLVLTNDASRIEIFRKEALTGLIFPKLAKT
jgi:hypothetical protein